MPEAVASRLTPKGAFMRLSELEISFLPNLGPDLKTTDRKVGLPRRSHMALA